MIHLATGMVPGGVGAGNAACWEEAQDSGTLEDTSAAAKEDVYCLRLPWPPSRAHGSGARPVPAHTPSWGGSLSSLIPVEIHLA